MAKADGTPGDDAFLLGNDIASSEVDAEEPYEPKFYPQHNDTFPSLSPGKVCTQRIKIGRNEFEFETGKLARSVGGAVRLSCGNTSILVTCTSEQPNSFQFAKRDPLVHYLDVEYREKTFAVGRIPGSWNRKEPQLMRDHEIVVSRRIERALRPLFPQGFVHDVNISALVLSIDSADGSSPPDVTAMNAASAALALSDVPWNGPIGAVRVALLEDGKCVINPPLAVGKVENSPHSAALNMLVVVGPDGRVVALEAEGKEVNEDDFRHALELGIRQATLLIEPQLSLAAKAGRQKRSGVILAGADPEALSKIRTIALPSISKILRNESLTKHSRDAALQACKNNTIESLRKTGSMRADMARVPGSGCVAPADIDAAWPAMLSAEMRKMAFQESIRIGGRGMIDLQPLHCELQPLPSVVHGSAEFSIGETQILCAVTVGGRGDAPRNESIVSLPEQEDTISPGLFVHYSFPSTMAHHPGLGKNQRVRTEAGHSWLIEKALAPLLPPQEDLLFPVRLNIETLGSNGSSSMASVCGGSLALKAAGIPMENLAAGVSVGMLSSAGHWSGESCVLSGEDPVPTIDLGQYELLTDVAGIEEELGDFNFRVAGTKRGITAAQLDVKVPGGIPTDILLSALSRARHGHSQLIKVMKKTSGVATGVLQKIKVSEGSIGRIIGVQGSTIRAMEEKTSARFAVVQDAAEVLVYAPNKEVFNDAKAALLAASGDALMEGQMYTARVSSLKDFGAFVEVQPGSMRALLHISELANDRIRSVEDILTVGQELRVVALAKGPRGELRVSRKAALANAKR